MIVTYLIKALTEKESVFVTNLGLFSQQYQAAQIRDGQIIPPCHKVVFDPNYDGNGFGFTMFVSMKAGMLTSDATVKVNQWVSELKNALDNNKSVSFENFGTFAKNDNGVITFESDRIAELNIDFEGMETVPLSHQPIHIPVEIQEEEDTSKIEQPTDNDNVAHAISETEETESAPVVEKNEQNTDNEADNTINSEEDITETPTEEAEIEQATDNDYVAPVISETEERESAPAVEENEQNTDNKADTTIIPEEDITTPDNEVDNTILPEEETTEKPKKRRAWLIIVIIILVLALLDALAYIFREEIEKLYNQKIDRDYIEEVTAEEPEAYSSEIFEEYTSEIDSVPEEATETVEMNETESTNQTGESVNYTSQTPASNSLSDDGNFIIRFEKGKHYVIAGSFPTEADVRKHIKQQHLEKYHPKAVKQDGVSNLRVCIGIFNSEAEAESFRNSVNTRYWVLN